MPPLRDPSPRESFFRTALARAVGPGGLAVTAAVLLGALPGQANLWTMEGRSGVICREMMRSRDYFHPYLLDEEYFDKPLVPYWLIIGAARLFGTLDEAALRLPGILAAWLAVAWIRRIGTVRFGPAAGLTAGWLLATTFCFAFWARVASSDILNLAAIVGAAAWFTERRDRPGIVTSGVFFAILAVGAQMKGLIAPAMAFLVILPDLLHEGRWRRHLRFSLMPAAVPAALIYLTPYLVASATAGGRYETSGLLMALRENVVRYFQPFDHKAPLYVYAEFLPLYLLPWTFFLPFVLHRAARSWRDLAPDSRAPLTASLLLFAFLTLSGGRRNYYALPIVPFVLLSVADWLHEPSAGTGRRKAALWTGALSGAGLLLYFGAVAPWLWHAGGCRVLAEEVRRTAEQHAPWPEWRVVLFDAGPQIVFYLDPADRAHRVTSEEALSAEVQAHPRTVVISARRAIGVLTRLGGGAALAERSVQPGSRGAPRLDPGAMVAVLINH